MIETTEGIKVAFHGLTNERDNLSSCRRVIMAITVNTITPAALNAIPVLNSNTLNSLSSESETDLESQLALATQQLLSSQASGSASPTSTQQIQRQILAIEQQLARLNAQQSSTDNVPVASSSSTPAVSINSIDIFV
jgi:hypothetical protein